MIQVSYLYLNISLVGFNLLLVCVYGIRKSIYLSSFDFLVALGMTSRLALCFWANERTEDGEKKSLNLLIIQPLG